MSKAELDSLRKGAKVEVNFEDPGFRGSWFTGTIVRPLCKKTRKILVEFDTLITDTDRPKPLREKVDLISVRPVPPREANRSFKVSEKVNAFHRDGWWEGIVIAVHPPPPPSSSPSSGTSSILTSYSVYFRCSGEQLRFWESDLRLDREWVHGSWKPPLEAP